MKKMFTAIVLLVGAYLVAGVCAWRVLPVKIAETERARGGLTLALGKIADDQLAVSRRVSEITAQTLDRGRDKVEQVSALLGDATLNRMALTYLGADWAVTRSSFVGSVKHMRDLQKMQKEERKKYANRLSEKVKELEAEKSKLLNQSVSNYRGSGNDGAQGSANMAQEQWRLKLADVDRELTAYRNSSTYREYIEKGKTAENEVEAKTRNEAAIFKMANDCEAQTVGQLVKVMAEKATALKVNEAESERLKSLLSYFNVWPLNMLAGTSN